MNTLKDLMWKPYVGDRKIAESVHGFSVIVPKDFEYSGISVFCDVCDCLMTSIYDEDAVKKFGCCDKCSSKWAYPNATKWSEGWRPSDKDVQDEVNLRRLT